MIFENLEPSRQRSRPTTHFHASQLPELFSLTLTIISHKTSYIHINIYISVQFCDDASIKLSNQNLICISPGSFKLFPVGLSTIRSFTDIHLPPLSGSQQGAGHYQHFQVRHLEARGCSRQQSRRLSKRWRGWDFQNKSVQWGLHLNDFRL